VGYRQAALWEGSHQFYAEHRGQTVLVGLNTYDIILRLESGADVLIPKGNIVYVHRAK
jgi:hypothetical protein